ncbi:heavy-metal-associated domain-containing protein [Ramlibacter sp.]|uniref:heavy-metal-associated domain-containing protein n=1 Tax=Ramlibacter sp. TaxID=1917967 RepID=UPI003D150139
MSQLFDVQGMSCSHCVAAVTQAVKQIDPSAEVKVDLASGRVEIESNSDAGPLARAIEAEGYRVSALG